MAIPSLRPTTNDSETLPPPSLNQRPSSSLRRRSRRVLNQQRRRRRAPRLTWQSASFHFSLFTVYLVIAFLWSIVPFSIGYLVYTILTATIPKLYDYRPAPHHLALKVIHWVFVGYCSLELPFTIIYKWLGWRQQKLRKPLRHSRKHLRGLILRSLENGLTLEQEYDKELLEGHERHQTKEPSEQTWVEKSTKLVDEEARGRKRSNRSRGDGAATPELSTTTKESHHSDYLSAKQQLPILRTNDPTPPLHPSTSRSTLDSPLDEGFSASRISLDSAFVSNSSSPRKPTNNTTSTSTSYPPTPHLPPPPPSSSSTSPPPRRSHSLHHGAPISGFIDPPLSPSDPRAIDFRNYLRFWFSGCDFTEIKKLNMADWLAWSLYGTTMEVLEQERKVWDRDGRPKLKLDSGESDEDDSDEFDEDTEIEGDKFGLVMHCVDLVEARAAHRFEPGRNEEIKTLRLTLDPVRVTQRPLILYLVVALLQNGVLAATRLKGFKEYKDGKVKYLGRIPKDWTPNATSEESHKPLVFIHGLGMGSAQYATFMSYLCSHRSFRNRPILILLQPHISMSFFEPAYHDPPDQTTLVDSLERMMKRLKFDEAGGATVLSHSNGTIVHAWLVKNSPNLCARNCFVDPVCFCLWEPFVCYNFLYSKPKTPIEYLMRYFVSRELGIAIMLSRTFEWTSNLLFPSQIPNLSDPSKSAVFLAQQDSILNAERVKTYLKRNGFKETVTRDSNTTTENDGGRLKVFEGLKHGQSMIGEGEAFEEIMEWICKAPKGTLAPGTASPNPSLPPSLAGSGAEDSTATGDETT